MTETQEIRTAIVERDFAHTPEKIWRALTQPHLLEEWLMATDFLPEMGRKFTFRREPSPEVKVVISCEVLTLEPYSTLAYSWSAFGLESVVTFTLESIATGTRLRMEQAGFTRDQDRAYKGALAAWTQFFGRLDSLVATLD